MTNESELETMGLRGLVRPTIDYWIESVRSLGARVYPDPIFILGNQKSGTTAIAALLSHMTGIQATLDFKKEWLRPTIHRVKRGEMTFDDFIERNRLGFSRRIIKEPGLTFFYDELAERFPASRIVMVVRDPRDNIRSILNRLGLPGDLHALDAIRLRKLPRGWRLNLDNSWLGIPGGNYVETLAHRWLLCCNLYARHAGRTVLCRYEQFTTDKAGEIGRLAHELRLAPRHDITARVNVPFQPAGDRDIGWRDFFGPANLNRIDEICGGRMEEFGYLPGGEALR